jgi:hypothetical protein
MTTQYAQNVHTQARGDVRLYGYIRPETQKALFDIGYNINAVAQLAGELIAAQGGKQ